MAKSKGKTFKMYIDEKQTIWQRHHYVVTAKTEAAAKKLIIDEMDFMRLSDDGPVKFKESEFLFENAEYMTPKENGGRATREAFKDDGGAVADNA